MALTAWNMMRGIEWQAVPLLVELLEVDDVESFVLALIQIREHKLAKEELDRNSEHPPK